MEWPFAFDGDHGKMVLSNKSRLVEFQAQNRAFAFVGDHGKMILILTIIGLWNFKLKI